MTDPRKKKLATIITHHSLQVAKGERVLIEAFDIPAEFTALLIETIADAGGVPLCLTKDNRVLRALYHVASEEQMRLWGEVEAHLMSNVQGYVGIRGTLNSTELGDVSANQRIDNRFDRIGKRILRLGFRGQ